MPIVPDEFFSEEIVVKLTRSEIEKIIDELGRVSHNMYNLFGYDKIIKKLRGENE